MCAVRESYSDKVDIEPKEKMATVPVSICVEWRRENLGIVNFNRVLVQHLKIEALNFPLGQEESVLLSVEHSVPQKACLERCSLPSSVE